MSEMAMLPNDYHPGPRCSCLECLIRYPAGEDVYVLTPKGQLVAEAIVNAACGEADADHLATQAKLDDQ